jgi:hypothetical protein
MPFEFAYAALSRVVEAALAETCAASETIARVNAHSTRKYPMKFR